MAALDRGAYRFLTGFAAVVAAIGWTSLAVRALVMDGEPSIKALFVCLALAFVGFALGSAIWVLTEARRRRRPADEVARAEMPAAQAMLGVMVVALGASPIVDASLGAWDWGLLVVGSLAGGLNLGVAFMGVADPAGASDSPAAVPRERSPSER